MSHETANNVIARYVVYNKQIERRMDGSSGGAFSAILETLVRDNYYFSGTVYGDELRVHHIVSNNPEDIPNISGYKPTPSDYTEAFSKIRELLKQGEKVVFCGTSFQCLELKKTVDDDSGLLLINIIHSPFVKQELVEKYNDFLKKTYGHKAISIRYCNREFDNPHSKRILLSNGRMVYTYETDFFDEREVSANYHVEEFYNNSVCQRVSDITLAGYNVNKDEDDGLGFSYLSVNSEKGASVFEKSKKRLVVVKTCDEVDMTRIIDSPPTIKSRKDKKSKLYYILKSIYKEWKFSDNSFRILYKFLRLNYFSKGVKIDLYNNGFVFLKGHCALKLVSNSFIELHGPLYLGLRRIKDSKQETRLRMEKGARLLVHKSCSFGAGSNVEIYKNALLEVGDLHSNAELTIVCGEHISLGTPCNVARNATIRDTSGHILSTPGYKMSRPVLIGNHTWICTGSTIMPGVTVGDGSIVGACSYVSKKVPAFSIVQGNPAAEVGTIKYFRL